VEGIVVTGLEIFIRDLNEEKQEQVLEFLGVENIEEGNLDVFPLCIIAPPEIEK